MADRNFDSDGGSRAKRQKTSKPDMDPRANPYLAHMYEPADGDANGAGDKGLKKLKRHQTTAADAKKLEDGEINPFNQQPYSTKYFSILEGRRDLPVHAQR